MNKSARRSIAVAGTTAALALAGTGAALATQGVGDHSSPLARGQLVSPVHIEEKVGDGFVKVLTKGDLDVLAARVTLDPGGSSGWHSHPGPHITIVQSGSITVIDSNCDASSLGAGQATFEAGGEAVEVKNPSATQPAVFYVEFLVPRGTKSPRIDEPVPAGCTP